LNNQNDNIKKQFKKLKNNMPCVNKGVKDLLQIKGDNLPEEVFLQIANGKDHITWNDLLQFKEKLDI